MCARVARAFRASLESPTLPEPPGVYETSLQQTAPPGGSERRTHQRRTVQECGADFEGSWRSSNSELRAERPAWLSNQLCICATQQQMAGLLRSQVPANRRCRALNIVGERCGCP